VDGIAYYSYEDLREYIAGEGRASASSCPQSDSAIGVDGWYRVLQDPRERVIGQSALLGGLITFTSYQPFSDLCTAEGMSSLYGVHYQMGTAWYENVFGTYSIDNRTVVRDKLSLGRGLAVTPSMHGGGDGTDAKAFVQTSTGEIIEIGQENLPIKPPASGKGDWCDDCE
jgi:type IV pilus assembly protein PilY1